MNIPIWSLINRINIESLIILIIVGALLFYFTTTNKVNGLFFMLILSASFVGSASATIADLSSLIRWVIISLLFYLSIMYSKLKMPAGIWLFMAYILFGWLALYGATNVTWQIQRAMLLLVTCVSITIAYTGRPLADYESALIKIAIAASLFSFINFLSLFSSSQDTYARFSASIKGAPTFAMTLGAFLPFTYWALWQAKNKTIRLLSGLGFLLGTATLIFSAQRAGTLAGLFSLVPLIIAMPKNRSDVIKTIFGVLALGIVCFTVFNISGLNRLIFLMERYSLDSGLSNRDGIWAFALSNIVQNPIFGRGIGAAESLIEASFHNTYLEVWFNAGLIGLLFFVAAQAYFFVRALHAWRRKDSSESKPIIALIIGYMLGFFILCMFESIGSGASNLNIILFLFLGTYITDSNFRNVQPLQMGIDYGARG